MKSRFCRQNTEHILQLKRIYMYILRNSSREKMSIPVLSIQITIRGYSLASQSHLA